MTDPDVAPGDIETNAGDHGEEQRRGRWWGLLAILLLLLLLMLCVVTSARVWVTGGGEQARFVARNAQCLQCHPEKIPDFSKSTVHSPFATKRCLSCHTPHGKRITVTVVGSPRQVWRQTITALKWLPFRLWLLLDAGAAEQVDTQSASLATASRTTKDVAGGKSGLIMPEERLCWMCHGDLGPKRNDPFQHQPFESSRCTNCHNPHASNFRALLTQPPNRICLTCHPMGEQLNRMQSHPPAKEGWCTDCHDPHASQYKGILVDNQRDLCFRCHPSVAVKSSMPVQHAPFLNDNCTGCHEPHGSDYMPLLDAPQPTLCYKCHAEIQNQFAQSSHHPVGVDLKCASCHDPHAAQYSGLLSARNNDFCYQCHGNFETRFASSKHNETLCIGCHTPHGSPYAPILRNSNPDLCLGCHAPKRYEEKRPGTTYANHPVRPAHYDVNARKGLTCTSSCHNPHGTDKTKMLRYFDAPYDGNCLMCHAVKKGDRVGIDF